MEIAVLLVVLAIGVLTVAALAERLDVPPPLLLIAVGAAVSYIPGVPEVHLEPEVVLLGLLPPLLYATAIQSSLVDFNTNRRSILLLSIVLVIATTLGIGAIVHSILPGISWPAAFAIGAVVAPPDAVAATAIGRRIGLPRRIVTILEGESLLNDATALVALGTAILALGHSLQAWRIGLDFVVAAGGGILVGLVTFKIVATVRKRLTNPVLDTAISFIVPFAAYLVAEEIHASGVLAVVVAGLLLGHKAPILQSAQSRIAERINWRTIAYILENAVFLLIGLQASWLLRDVGTSSLPATTIVGVCVATLVGVIGIRMVWVFIARFALIRPVADASTGVVPSWRYTFLIGWAGMRGVVTLAAAFIIPIGTEYREILLLIAFTVVAGTLFVQGLTLPVLARCLEVPSPDPMDDALARATLLQQASKAGYKALDALDYDDPHGVEALVRQRVDQRNFSAWERLGTTADQETPSELYARVRLAMIQAERARILEIRSAGTVPSEVVGDVLAMLDVEESMIDVATEARQDIRTANGQRAHPGVGCDELDRYPVAENTSDGTCHECIRAGTEWVALRQCLECGHVACCDSSPLQHATAHFHDTTHPVMQSVEPGEDWRWCYVHHLTA
ncbi:MAG: Na+/H+ antiporter [Rhodococcus sp. (in: high G+C Gram-positive bacteria)]|uniref:Na+/H+ antiporter n=1 Tax=Rhodococcus sp. EPR-157 TaxID=1813677 RepID=UPI0007BC0D0F|nr:Na+/H+ antiporter [Rhodococcus sp. EPR-157]KZF08053.1 sodium:proton antiporter [Rhodococcus sp. EPR-157]